MAEGSDGSLCVLDALRRSNGGDWSYENSMATATNLDREGPKLEDFLGSYSNSTQENNNVYLHQREENPISGCGINVNVPPTFNTNGETKKFSNPSFHYNDNSQPLISSVPIHVPLENATSISGFKSWLRQTAFSGDKSSSEANTI